MRKLLKKFGRGLGVQGYSYLRRALDSLTASGGPPFFIQIGANNGIDFDDLFVAVTEHKMPGLAVEPIAEYHRSLKIAYARHPGVTAIRAAIHPSASSITMYRVDPQAVTIAWQHGLASLDREHLLRHDVPESAIIAEDVPCLSFADLMKRVPAGRRVGVLAIDTEGFDLEILRMVDFEAMRPAIVRFEAEHMPRADFEQWMGRLRSLGYRTRIEGFDCLAVHRSVPVAPLPRFAAALGRKVGRRGASRGRADPTTRSI